MSTTTNTSVIDPEERAVEEAHCSECGVPISAIPSWYANVAVRFTCDNCRQKSPKLTPGLPAAAADVEAPRATAIDPDAEVEPALDDIDIDEVEIEDADADAELEVTEE
jgi:hypothetical protein